LLLGFVVTVHDYLISQSVFFSLDEILPQIDTQNAFPDTIYYYPKSLPVNFSTSNLPFKNVLYRL